MSSKSDCCFFGRGEVFLAEDQDNTGWGCSWGYCYGGGEGSFFAGRYLGNVSQVGLSIASSVRQSITPQGITFDSGCGAITIDNVEFSMSISCQTASNLALAFSGVSNKRTFKSETVTNRAILPNNNNFIDCNSFYCIDPGGIDPSTVVITREDTSATLVAGEDYLASPSGIKFLVGLSLAPNTSLLLSFSFNTTTVTEIQPLTKEIKPVTLTYKGVNLVDGSEFTAVFYRVLLSPTTVYNLISQDFEDLQLSGILLADTTRPSGTSQYFKITRIPASASAVA